MNQQRTFEDVERFMRSFLGSRDRLRDEIVKLVSNFDTLMKIILHNLRYVLEHDGELEEATLLDGDVARLSMLNMQLPFFTLSEDYESMPEFSEAYTLLLRNYCQAYGVEGNLSDTLEAMEKLLATKHTYTRLLVIAQQLISRYDMLRQYCPETLQVSARYLQYLVDHEPKEDKQNVQGQAE